MALIIEDGSIVVNANSYNTRAELIAYAALRGTVLLDDETTDHKAVEAIDYLELFREEYKGRETDPVNQYLAWPRTGVTVGAGIVGNNSIPRRIKEAQAALVLVAASGVKLVPTKRSDQPFLVRQKLGPIEKQYSEALALGAPALPTIPGVAALLAPFLDDTGAGPTRTYKV